VTDDDVTKERDAALVRVVLERVESRLSDPFSLDGLSETEADLLAAVTAFGVIGNGGHVFWFQGKNRKQTLRAALAFERMGLAAAASSLRGALTAFPGGEPKLAYLDAHRGELEQAWSTADELVWGVDYDAAAAEFIRARRAELLDEHPALAPYLSVH
jgi:hypothetical protein